MAIEHIDHINRNYRSTNGVKCIRCKKEIENHSDIYVIERSGRRKDIVFCSKKCLTKINTDGFHSNEQLTIWYCMLQKEEVKKL